VRQPRPRHHVGASSARLVGVMMASAVRRATGNDLRRLKTILEAS
jgi:hypothetical protein